MTNKATNITRVPHLVTAAHRCDRYGHRGGVLWFTGLPASGKSTLAYALEQRLFEAGYEVFAFNSARLRGGLNSDLGFSRDDRRENIRRAGELAAVMARAGVVVITAFISPYRADREAARAATGQGFHEIFLNPGVEICERRDGRDRYASARRGEIEDFTGISAPYEASEGCELEIDTGVVTAGEALDILDDYTARVMRPRP